MSFTFEVCGHFINNNKGKGGNKYPPLSRDAKGAISIYRNIVTKLLHLHVTLTNTTQFPKSSEIKLSLKSKYQCYFKYM
jgi:hypothetical protein